MPRFAQGHAETEKGSAQVRPGSPLRQPAANPAADQSVARERTSKELRQPDIREDFTRIPTYSGSDETPPVAAVFSSAVAPPVGTVQRKCDACREVDENIRPFKDTHARQAHPIGDKMRPPSCSAGSKVSAAGDSYEQEADRTADQVMSTRAHPSPGSVPVGVQRAAGQPGEHLEAAPASVSSAVAKPRAPLEPALRHDMELRFGRDFSRVRVHTDAAAEQSSRDVKAHAYTTGHDIVFGANQFAPETQPGRRLIAHELTHVVQQRGENHLVQRAPANYPSNAPVPAPVAPKEKAVPQLSTDDWIWLLETLRRDSPQEFLKILAANEAYFYPILSPHGFRGSWEKEQDYLTDFDAAVLKWGKSHTYSVMYPHISRPIARQRPKSREEQKYEYANYLVRDMNRHGYGRGKVNSELESAGLMDDLEAHGFEKHDRWSFKNHVEYRNEAIVALNAYIDRYDAAHGNPRQTSANVPTQGEDVEFYRAWLEGLGYVTSSFFAAAFANAASKFTSDPKKITAAAGLGVAVEGVVFSMGAALGAGGTYRPNVVGPQDRPTAVGSWRYSGKQPIKPIVDPWKVGTPTPDVKPAGKTTASDPNVPAAQKQPPPAPTPRSQRRYVPSPPVKGPPSTIPVQRPTPQQVANLWERFNAIARKDVSVGPDATVTVGVQVRIKLSGEPILVGLKSGKFETFHESRGIGGSQRAAILPPVKNPPKVPAKRGTHQPSSGVIVEPAPKSQEIEILAVNTSRPVRLANVSHAEAQVISYLMDQEAEWLARVESIEAIVLGRDICEGCERWIQDLKTTISKLKNDRKLPDAKISWIRGD